MCDAPQGKDSEADTKDSAPKGGVEIDEEDAGHQQGPKKIGIALYVFTGIENKLTMAHKIVG